VREQVNPAACDAVSGGSVTRTSPHLLVRADHGLRFLNATTRFDSARGGYGS
jgi:hypothetical protein